MCIFWGGRLFLAQMDSSVIKVWVEFNRTAN